jgi:hypothetical protein
LLGLRVKMTFYIRPVLATAWLRTYGCTPAKRLMASSITNSICPHGSLNARPEGIMSGAQSLIMISPVGAVPLWQIRTLSYCARSAPVPRPDPKVLVPELTKAFLARPIANREGAAGHWLAALAFETLAEGS